MYACNHLMGFYVIRLLLKSLNFEIKPLIRILITATTLQLLLPIAISDRLVENSVVLTPIPGTAWQFSM